MLRLRANIHPPHKVPPTVPHPAKTSMYSITSTPIRPPQRLHPPPQPAAGKSKSTQPTHGAHASPCTAHHHIAHHLPSVSVWLNSPRA
ncbi:hypothetical protein M011DRAFT_136092 [Sporormia fimetaria CBS 119925]|uniref:Uncharacterized protein n=1 Tax=Sporormia fimetaria CBS 119925 TaxID=1340428 RepID=A0A6A6V4L2_9PLEO|nr:hypothetical protein M011DRAFT_136092 [Sporormia fimetaria CBS 119925]